MINKRATCYAILSLIIAVTTPACLSLNPGLNSPASPAQQSVLESPVTNNEGGFTTGLTSPRAGLDQLASYQAQLEMDFEGTHRGEAVRGSIESRREVTRQPAALRQYLKIEATPAAAISPGISEFFRMAGNIYVKKATDETWLTLSDDPATPPELGFFEAERFVILPRAVSSPPRLDTLNGQTVKHYRFNAGDLNDPNLIFEQAQGDLWIAAQGQYLVQYVISGTFRVLIPNPQTDLFNQGRLNLRYTLTGVNTDFVIDPPAQALIDDRNPLSQLPRLPDAELIAVFPTLIEYTSALSSISATLFYQDELAGLGWSQAANPDIFIEKSRLTFSKAEETLTILITPSNDEPERIKVVMDIRP